MQRSLRSQKKAFDKMIAELEPKASEEEVMERLGHLVNERESIKRKLSTTYSLGRDGEGMHSKSLLPLHDEKGRSYSFQGSKKESVTIFHTFSDEESSDSDDFSSLVEDADDDMSQDEALDSKGKGKVGEESCSDCETSEDEYVRPFYSEREYDDDDEQHGESRSLRRRTVSFNS